MGADAEDSDDGYEPDPDYEAEVQRLLAKAFFIDNLSADVLATWMFEHPMPSAADLDLGFEKERSGATHDLRTLKDDRRQLSDKRLARIVQRLESRYRLIHPELTDGRTTIVPSTDELKQMTKSSMGLVDVLPMDRFVQEEQSDDKGSRIETSAEERDRFFRMQESLNTEWLLKFHFHCFDLGDA